MNEYIKLRDLVDSYFEVQKILGYNYKRWDNEAKRMDTKTEPTKGYRKIYQVLTDKGTLDLGTGQIGTLLEAALDVPGGWSRLVGRKFKVSSNGKEGIDIRYYFDAVRDLSEDEDEEEEVILNDEEIPF